MPRKSHAESEFGFIQSLWTEISAIEREYNATVTIVMHNHTRRGIIIVEMRALVLGMSGDGLPVSHSVIANLPSAGNLMFMGELWGTARKLHAVVCDAAEAQRRHGQ